MTDNQPIDFSRNDRDMLIVLNTKVDQLTFNVNDMKTDSVSRLAKLEAWKDSVDLYHARIPLEEYDRLAQWVRGFKSNIIFIIGLGGLAFGIIGGVVSQFFAKWLHLN